ncbi:MAG: STAS domain-containing protein [Fuerstiella sp.]
MIDFKSYQPENNADVLVVELSGRLDSESAETFFERLEQELKAGHNKLIFDCKLLTNISSLGFGMMMRAHSRLKQAGGAVRFSRLEGFIEEAFQIVGFNKLFENFRSIEDAAASFD